METSENTLGQMIAKQARERPERVAFQCDGRETSYHELDVMSNQLANRLTAEGVRFGHRVAYIGLDSEWYYALALGCAKIGAVIVPLNWRFTALEALNLIVQSEACMVFVECKFRQIANAIMEMPPPRPDVIMNFDSSKSHGSFLAWCSDASAEQPKVSVRPSDAAVQIYTSGTTGNPKGAVLPHSAFFSLLGALKSGGIDWIDPTSADVSLVALPGFHTSGFSWTMQGLSVGLKNVLMPLFIPQLALQLIQEQSVTMTFVVPAMLQMLLAEAGAGPQCFSSLRKVVYGGSPISEDLLRRCLETIQSDFIQAYASTETGNGVVLLPPDVHKPGDPRLRAAGRAVPGVEVGVFGSPGERVGTGEMGEVYVKFPTPMIEYWREPEATAKAFVDDWLRMGDIGYLDAENFLFLCDRAKDVIIVAGENIYPAEIENQLEAHPDVVEAAVVGIRHERWGEAVHACVVLHPGRELTGRDLAIFLRKTVADFKIPSSWEFVDSLPRNPTGKVLRRVLRDQRKVGHPATTNAADRSS